MKHQAKLKGTVVEVLNSSYINVETADKEIVPCYVVKKVVSKDWTPNVGTPAIFKGGFKTFANGTNYFVIHKIENYKLGVYNTATYVDKNEELPFLQRVIKAIKNAPCRKYMFDSVKAELIDSATGEKTEFTLPTSETFELKFWGSNCAAYEIHEKNVFYCPGIFKELNNANLANKKWGSKIEGKLKVQILEIREKIGCDSWTYTNLEEVESFRGDHYKKIKETLHSRKDQFASKHEWNPIGGGYAHFEVTKVRIIVQR